MEKVKQTNRERLITDITARQDELQKLGVKFRERFRYYKFSDAELEGILSGFEEQVKQRRKFLGEK